MQEIRKLNLGGKMGDKLGENKSFYTRDSIETSHSPSLALLSRIFIHFNFEFDFSTMIELRNSSTESKIFQTYSLTFKLVTDN